MKNIFSEQLKYLRNNPEDLWFKRKLFGWGWVPVKWQGWFVVFGFILFLMWNSKAFGVEAEPSSTEMIWFFGKNIVAVAILIIICYIKGEKPRWQWGFPKDKKDGISNKDK